MCVVSDLQGGVVHTAATEGGDIIKEDERTINNLS